MANSNTEAVYFCLAALTFFLWAFLAGLLLKLENRYIGISFNSATIAIVYLYVIARVKQSMFITYEDFNYVNLHFDEDAIGHSLEVKRRWREQDCGEKKLSMKGEE